MVVWALLVLAMLTLLCTVLCVRWIVWLFRDAPESLLPGTPWYGVVVSVRHSPVDLTRIPRRWRRWYGHRVLLRGQADWTENGVYSVNDKGLWQRCKDLCRPTQVHDGAWIFCTRPRSLWVLRAFPDLKGVGDGFPGLQFGAWYLDQCGTDTLAEDTADKTSSNIVVVERMIRTERVLKLVLPDDLQSGPWQVQWTAAPHATYCLSGWKTSGGRWLWDWRRAVTNHIAWKGDNCRPEWRDETSTWHWPATLTPVPERVCVRPEQ